MVIFMRCWGIIWIILRVKNSWGHSLIDILQVLGILSPWTPSGGYGEESKTCLHDWQGEGKRRPYEVFPYKDLSPGSFLAWRKDTSFLLSLYLFSLRVGKRLHHLWRLRPRDKPTKRLRFSHKIVECCPFPPPNHHTKRTLVK